MPRRSIVFCYAPADNGAAREFAGFLEANLDCEVCLDEAVIGPDQDLIAAAEKGLSADAAFVLLSPASAPKIWKREQWEPIFFGEAGEVRTPLGFALLRECKFPGLLRRRAFFDLSCDPLQGAREARHWLMRREGVAAKTTVLAELRSGIADRPGLARTTLSETARTFASVYGGDFEAVHHVACHGRSRAGILGDLGYATGVPLSGNVAQNRAVLERECLHHRWLFILEDLPPEHEEWCAFGGRTSVLITQPERLREPVSVEELSAAFFALSRDNDRCAPLIGSATLRVFELLPDDFESGLRLGWALLAVLKSFARFAEMIEILAAMEEAARLRGDEMALFKIEWEQSWISEDSDAWGIRILPTAGEDVAQLSLFDIPV